jgi:hypothetical protein
VHCFADGTNTVAGIRSSHPDLAVLDLGLPDKAPVSGTRSSAPPAWFVRRRFVDGLCLACRTIDKWRFPGQQEASTTCTTADAALNDRTCIDSSKLAIGWLHNLGNFSDPAESRAEVPGRAAGTFGRKPGQRHMGRPASLACRSGQLRTAECPESSALSTTDQNGVPGYPTERER